MTPWGKACCIPGLANCMPAILAAGQAQGQPYAEASYVTTLSFVQKDGLASPALPEPPTKGH